MSCEELSGLSSQLGRNVVVGQMPRFSRAGFSSDPNLPYSGWSMSLCMVKGVVASYNCMHHLIGRNWYVILETAGQDNCDSLVDMAEITSHCLDSMCKACSVAACDHHVTLKQLATGLKVVGDVKNAVSSAKAYARNMSGVVSASRQKCIHQSHDMERYSVCH